MASLDQLFKTRREKVIFYCTCGVIVLAISFNWIFYPLADQWFSTSAKLGSRVTELKKVKELLKNEPKIMADYDQYQKVIRLKDPQKRPEDTLLLQADELQREVNLHYTRMDPVYKRKIDKTNYQAYTLQVTFESDLTTVGLFLKGMQERGLFIDYLQLSPKSKTAKSPVITATIRIGKIINKEEEKDKTR